MSLDKNGRDVGVNYCRNCTHHVKLHKEPDEFEVSCRWSMLKLHEPHDPETDEPLPQLISEITELTCNCEQFVSEAKKDSSND
jgi:hypothetical protein